MVAGLGNEDDPAVERRGEVVREVGSAEGNVTFVEGASGAAVQLDLPKAHLERHGVPRRDDDPSVAMTLSLGRSDDLEQLPVGNGAG